MPTKQKDIQKLIGRVAALNRFVSKSTERCLPESFQRAEAISRNCHNPGASGDAIELFLYLSVTDSTIAAVLLKEEDGR